MRLHHVGWVVKDSEKAARQFEREGAVTITDRIVDPVQRVIVQFFGDRTGALVWETVSPQLSVEASPLESRLARGGGLDHVCYELEDGDGTLESVLESEIEQRSRVICPPTFATAFGRRIAFVYRPSGSVVEFVEMRKPGDVV